MIPNILLKGYETGELLSWMYFPKEKTKKAKNYHTAETALYSSKLIHSNSEDC